MRVYLVIWRTYMTVVCGARPILGITLGSGYIPDCFYWGLVRAMHLASRPHVYDDFDNTGL